VTLNEWIVQGEVGISSKTMWAALQNIEYNGNKPYDPDDFSRCFKFYMLCRLTKDDLEKIAIKLPYWKPYIDNWEELSRMYSLNVVNNWKTSEEIGMYEFMSKLEKESDKIKRDM
jgi:hypothetical protein